MGLSKSNKPLVSIGMPAYNGERHIRKALDSLLVQDYENFELIISDNVSTDATREICRQYADTNQRIRLFLNQYNISVNENFKSVLEKANGKYFMWAADDDYWFPEFVSTMVKELEMHPETGVAMCTVDRVYDNGNFFDTIRFINDDDPNHRTYYQMLKGMTSPKKYNMYIYGIFKTNILKQAIHLFYEVPGADRVFLCQFALATRFRYVDRVLHIRTIYEEPFRLRRSQEKRSMIQNKDKAVDIKVLLALAQTILRSPIIPWYRKFYLPIAIWRYGWLLVTSRIKEKVIGRIITKVKERVTPETWNRLKKIKRWLLSD